MKPVIITCAVTGSLHTPSMSPYLPITPAQIAEHAIGASEAGASILHLHARDPENGKPTADPEVFRQFLPHIKQSAEAIINISTGGAPGMTMDDRLAAAEAASPELASLNMGSINLGIFPAAEKMSDYRFDWEKPFLEGSKDTVFKNSFADIEAILNRLGKGQGCRFEFECYDMAHLYNLAYFLDQKLYEPPLFIQFCLGLLGGIGAETDHLVHMVRTAQRLFGDDIEWSVLAAGRNQLPVGTQNILLGGNARVGLEDSLTIARKTLAKNSAEQVTKLAKIIDLLGYEIATPDEARQRLALKGGDQVNF